MSTWPSFEHDEIAAVADVLSSGRVNYWTGDLGKRFEAGFAAYVDCRHGIAVSNGTVSLSTALSCLKIGPGDEVVVTPRTFVASASCIALSGARPVFADVDPVSQNVTADTIAAVLSKRTRAIVAVHLAGWPCRMDDIMALADGHGLHVIEDCAQAHGARFRDVPVGKWGHIGSFSFCQDKIMSTGGEGGIIVTDDEALWQSAWSHKDHGKSYDAIFHQRHPLGFRWLHHSFGSNYRMTEMQAAIGLCQLSKLQGWLNHRRTMAAILDEAFSSLKALRVVSPPPEVEHAYYKYYAFVRPEALAPGWNRDRIMREVINRQVPCLAGICPEVYREKAFVDAGFRPAEDLPVARELGRTSLMLHIDPTVDRDATFRAADVVSDVMKIATR